MSKREMYFKFIFPKYENLQSQAVIDLCDWFKDKTYVEAENKKPFGYVTTYERLASKGLSRIKNYIDYYKDNIPKYFDIRNYIDQDIDVQAGGFSLIVSDSPEVNKDSKHGWTKFKSSAVTKDNSDTRVVYCSVIVSSGDFYYNWNLPEEVLHKAVYLRNKVVIDKFHTNWYLQSNEHTDNFTKYNIGREKRVFNRAYFDSKRQYGIITNSQHSVENEKYVEVPKKYTDLVEDLKRDFVDLEVTRRVLYSNDNEISNITIPTIVGTSTGINTVLSYDPPQDYKNFPPMPIPYDLLRNTLNDNDPYGDCETVLVMWVADTDPADKKGTTGVKELVWEQYAIPISVRCVVKKNGEDTYNENRFLISYPFDEDITGETKFKFHVRRNDKYNKNDFKEALYLPDLIKYSNDYLITFQYTSINNNSYKKAFDIQNYLFKKHNYTCSALYVRKQAEAQTADNKQNQSYYMLVDSNKYTINKVNVNDPSKGRNYINNTKGKPFEPSKVLSIDDYKRWNFDDKSWGFKDTFFIVLFNKSAKDNNGNVIQSSVITEKSGEVVLIDAKGDTGLKSKLNNAVKDNSGNEWKDLYLCSFGVTYLKLRNVDWFLYGKDFPCVPLGFLDGHIQIDSTEYGSNKPNKKVVVGFKNAFDYASDDYYHFIYNDTTGKYTCSNPTSMTAYVMNYTTTT